MRTPDKRIQKSVDYFNEGYACSQSVFMAFCEEFGVDLENAKKISSGFGGGMGRLRRTCGALTGGFMVLGLKYGNTDPKDMKSKILTYEKIRELTQNFEQIHDTSICKQILKNHATKEEVKERRHHKIICKKVVRDAATLLADLLT